MNKMTKSRKEISFLLFIIALDIFLFLKIVVYFSL